MTILKTSVDSGTVVLSAPDFVMDQVSYQSSWHLQLLDDEKGKALERIDPLGESNSSLNWRTAAESESFGTPAYKNSQMRTSELNQGVFEVIYETVTPNNNGQFDYLEINYSFEEASLLGTFTIFDKTGQIVKEVFQNQILGTEGVLVWDIYNEDQQLASSGTYIAVLEVFSENSGITILKKKAFVVYKEP